MIQAVLFNLYGTLVQTEKLKAQSYAIAVQRLKNLDEPENRVLDLYRQVVGLTREEVSSFLMESLELEPLLQSRIATGSKDRPQDLLTQMRLSIYTEMVADPSVFRANQWPHTVGLLRTVRENSCKIGLVTSSRREEAFHVLRSIKVDGLIDVVVARDDVENHKPHPEPYLLATEQLALAPADCLAVEDSPTGVRAAAAAGTYVVAVATPFTVAGLHKDELVEHAWIVHTPEELLEVVADRIRDHDREQHIAE